MSSSPASPNWRDDLDHISQLVDEEISATREAAQRDTARTTAESLNQSIRRLRQAPDESSLLTTLIDLTSPHAARAASIVFDATRARAINIRGFVSPEIQFDIAKAAAVLSAIDTKDPIVAALTDAEFSTELSTAALRDLETIERGYLFPVVAAGSVRALLFALGSVQAAPLELLTEAAALRLELLDVTQKPSTPTTPRAWTDLPPADQALHLKAQRFARVAVAEMRLARPSAVQEGQQRGTIYQTLRPEIDSARQTFRKEFVETAPSMVDYLYIELVRSLANDDDRLLGPDFPGRLI